MWQNLPPITRCCETASRENVKATLNKACAVLSERKELWCHELSICGHTETRVLDSRPHDERIRRRRECLGCGKRFTTYEAVDRPMLMVQKKTVLMNPLTGINW